MRVWILAALLFVAGLLVVAGVAQWSSAASKVVGGLLLAGWAWITFADAEEPA